MEQIEKYATDLHNKSIAIIEDIGKLIKTIIEAIFYLKDLYKQLKNFSLTKPVLEFAQVFSQLDDDYNNAAKLLPDFIKISELFAPTLKTDTEVKSEIIKIESGMMQTFIKLHRIVDKNPAFKWITECIDKIIIRIKKLV